jgi:hypothetical protein
LNDTRALCTKIRAAGAWSFVDAVQSAPHVLVDVQDIGCDFLACSAYKFFGPHQSLLWGRRDILQRLEPYKVRPAPEELPWRFETGTQSHEGIAGIGAAIDYFAGFGGLPSQGVDSSAIAFEIAAKGAFRQSMPKAGPQLLEPIMKVDVFSPEDHVGDVIGDLNRRRGMISGQEAGVTGVRIKADVPLSEMFGYISTLRTMTSGRGQFSMEFSHYAPCPVNVAEAVIAKEKEKKAAAKN